MKSKKGQTVEVMLAGIIAVIVGVAMLPIFSSLIDDAQDIKAIEKEQVTNTAFNESFTLNNLKLVVGSIVVLNSTCTQDDASVGLNCTLRDTSEFDVNEITALLTIVNRTGTWNVSYDYKPTTYIDSAVGRTVVRNVTLMYAVALIIITLAAVGITVLRG